MDKTWLPIFKIYMCILILGSFNLYPQAEPQFIKAPEDRVVLAEERKKPSSQGSPKSPPELKMPDDSLKILGCYLYIETSHSICPHDQRGAFLGK